MPANQVFVDTGAFLALVNRDDALHPAAADIEAELTRANTPLVTTDWVWSSF